MNRCHRVLEKILEEAGLSSESLREYGQREEQPKPAVVWIVRNGKHEGKDAVVVTASLPIAAAEFFRGVVLSHRGATFLVDEQVWLRFDRSND